jgi:hypothetical protein
VVTADGVEEELDESSEELEPAESPDELEDPASSPGLDEPESSKVLEPESSSEELELDESSSVESSDVLPDDEEDDDADAVGCVVVDAVVVAPIEPVYAMVPNAIANVASAAAATRLRSRAIRAARARRRSWASSFGDGVVCSVGEGVRSDMARTVGAGCESPLGATWELAEPRRRLSAGAQRGLRPLPAGAPTIRDGRGRAPVTDARGVPMYDCLRRAGALAAAS